MKIADERTATLPMEKILSSSEMRLAHSTSGSGRYYSTSHQGHFEVEHNFSTENLAEKLLEML